MGPNRKGASSYPKIVEGEFVEDPCCFFIANPHYEELLERHFSLILQRLKDVTKAFPVEYTIISACATHVLSAEALVEALESNLKSQNPDALTYERLRKDHQDRVLLKVKDFSKRPSEERDLINKVYRYTNVSLILLGYEHNLIDAYDVVFALEMPQSFEEDVLPKLDNADLLIPRPKSDSGPAPDGTKKTTN